MQIFLIWVSAKLLTYILIKVPYMVTDPLKVLLLIMVHHLLVFLGAFLAILSPMSMQSISKHLEASLTVPCCFITGTIVCPFLNLSLIGLTLKAFTISKDYELTIVIPCPGLYDNILLEL